MSLNQTKRIQVRSDLMHAAGVSDPGRMRSGNEDAIYLDDAGTFVLLADGMGGHERGAEASRTALEVIREFFTPETMADEMADITAGGGIPAEISCYLSLAETAVRRANSVIYERNRAEGLRRFMGTTVVGLAVAPGGHVFWFHVGDSRIYRMREGVLEQITVDHSAYNEWVRKGRNGEAPKKNIITRAIGPNPAVSASTAWETARSGDQYLLCSDGLSDMLEDERIAEIILAGGADVAQIADSLIEAANEAGGKDNVSAIVCRTGP